MEEATPTSLTGLFKRLGSLIRGFAADMERLVEEHDVQAPTSEIREVIDHIKSRTPTDEKDKHENDEIVKLLGQLSSDKRVFSLIKLETEEWEELLGAIETRVEMGKESFGSEEQEEYERMIQTTRELRDALKKQRK